MKCEKVFRQNGAECCSRAAGIIPFSGLDRYGFSRTEKIIPVSYMTIFYKQGYNKPHGKNT